MLATPRSRGSSVLLTTPRRRASGLPSPADTRSARRTAGTLGASSTGWWSCSRAGGGSGRRGRSRKKRKPARDGLSLKWLALAQSDVNPSRTAYFVSAATECSPSVRMMFRRCTSTVATVMPSRSAMQGERFPSVISLSTSRSRAPRARRRCTRARRLAAPPWTGARRVHSSSRRRTDSLSCFRASRGSGRWAATGKKCERAGGKSNRAGEIRRRSLRTSPPPLTEVKIAAPRTAESCSSSGDLLEQLEKEPPSSDSLT